MSWLAGLFTALSIFVGGMLGGHASSSALHTPASKPASQEQSPNGNAYYGSQPDPHFTALMQQIGCSDQSSCIQICEKSSSQACTELQSIMAGQESQGRSSSAYTAGTPSGGRGADVAAVGNNIDATAGALPDCPASNGFFTASPVTISSLAGIEPLGHMNAEHILPNQADHIYIDAKSTSSTAVYAPGNATLLGVAETTGIAGEDAGSKTVKLFFSPCKNVMFALQINTLDPGIQKALASLQPSGVQKGATVENLSYGPLDIPLTAGEALGTLVGMNGRGGEGDFAAVDMRTPALPFLDQSEQTGMLADSYAHAVCPLDYFASPLKSTLYSLLMTKDAGANGIPACGSVMQDKAGTAQGNWYDKNGMTLSYQGIDEASLLAIAHYNLDPAEGIVSVGTDLIPNTRLGTQIIFTPEHSGLVNREPSEVTPGETYCFDGTSGGGELHVDIELTSANALKADYGSGSCASAPALAASAVTYER